ncbi:MULTISPECIES: phage tail length tape measure family protein [unclassified Yoonia]|uniref:phage tail length tape measure family protein n=1 Tax=unclassified Yoonia TaxID=2629118 RepID=UPI002AFDE5C6|nr:MULTISPECIES: phage tail length tape measure family protein [unclassified Yoonia]
MSDFVVSGRITADSTDAERALKGTGDAMRQAGTETSKLGQEGRKAATQTDTLTRAERQASQAANALAASNTKAALTARQVGAANGVAAGSLSNLTAQFNDIGVMLAAGQNPLQLALQQGTQISQVIGPMGAAGAVKSLGAAFLGMLNPVSLVTIGTIAGGAALFQYAQGALAAGRDSRTFEEILDSLSESVSTYTELVDLADTSTDDLTERFGAASAAARVTAEFLAELARVEAIRDVDAAVQALTETFGGLSRTDLVSTRGGVMAEIGRTMFALRDELDLTDDQAAAVVVSLEQLANAGSMTEKIEAANDLQEAFQRVFGSVENIPPALANVAREAGLVALQAGEIEGAIAPAIDTTQRLISTYQQYARTRQMGANAERQDALELLATMQAQNDLQAVINDFGADSLEVAKQRAEAERDAFEETLAGRDISEELKDELRNAFDAAVSLSQVDLTSGLSGAAGEARQIARELGISLEAAQRLQGFNSEIDRLQFETSIQGLSEVDRRIATAQRQMEIDPDSDQGGQLAEQIRANYAAEQARRDREAGSRGRSRTRRPEVDPTEKLITNLEQELAILRELDPVQQEMLRQREALNGASAAQREQIEGLITTRLREADAMELAEANIQTLRDVSYSVFDDLIDSGGDLESVLNNLSNALIKMIQQALLLGEGPLASILSPGGGGGLIGSVINAVLPGRGGIPGRADGGMIPGYADGGDLQVGGRAAGTLSGVGGPREDNILFWGSDGEFMVNARSTAKYRHILEAINQDRMPAFADGGRLGSTNSSPAVLTPFGSADMTAQRGDGSVPRIELVVTAADGVTVEQAGEIAASVALTIQQGSARAQQKAMPGQLTASQLRRG